MIYERTSRTGRKMPELRVVVAGSGGRMGRALARAVLSEPKMRLVGALDRAEAAEQGKDVGVLAGVEPCGISVSSDPLPAFANTDVVLDFTAPAATLFYAELSAQARIVHVIGTTGLAKEHDEKFKAAARHCRIVRSGNMSLGVNVLAALVRRAAATLGPDYDIEVVEMHHKHKVDAPSGTALRLGEAAAAAMDTTLAQAAVYAREGTTGPRTAGTIGFATLRGGDVVGEHTVIYAGEGERIEITHRAMSRQNFAGGALRAARFVAARRAARQSGLYDMNDVLGLK